LIDKFGHLDRGLKKDLKEREKIKTKIFADIAPTLILWDISKYYLCTSQDRRKRYGSPFPYIRGDIDRQQRKVFQNPHTQVVDLLREKEKEHILSVPDMDLLLHKKFKFEGRIKNLNIKLNYAAVGPAIVFTNSNYTIKEVSYAFKVGEKSIKREINNMKSIRKPSTKRSRDFIDLVKNKS
jgi:Zn-finger domain-containing protein